MNGDGTTLQTLPESGPPPECRMQDALATQAFVKRLSDNDGSRSKKRARVNGLVDGNPPYKAANLRAAGRAEACNVNWGTARSTLETSSGGFYDLSTEAPGIFDFLTDFGPQEQRGIWSSIACRHANKIIRDDPKWDAYEQKSQKQMVLHGVGPYVFEDSQTVFPKSILAGDLKVPEFTPSNTEDWDAASIEVTYYPPELYKFIQNAEAATTAGWDVKYTRRVIANAIDVRQQQDQNYDWEWCQQQMKNNSLTYYDDSKIVRVAHVFWREFDGRVTHAMVDRNSYAGLKTEYLFIHVGRYRSFAECVHPMYFDIGTNGYHHEVTGLGVKMYSAMEYENRLICNLCDKAFAPKIIFKPTSAEAGQKFSLAHFGDYAVMPPNFDWQQTPIGGVMNDGEAMLGIIKGTVQENLSSYRGGVPDQKSGNPVTKFEKQLQAVQQAAMNKTQFNRYYVQRDKLLAEIWRRLINPNSTDDRAIEFQKKCKADGVPLEALSRWQYVGACRVVGQGSAFMRKQAIDSLFPIAGSLPEEGRVNLLTDKIAAEAGQGAIERYYPKKAEVQATDQQAEALLWVGAMKVGVPPVVTSSQNALTFAATFMKAATDAVNSVKQGADPMAVLSFLHLAGPAIAAQLKRMSNDPTRQQPMQVLMKQWQQLAQITDQLQAQVQRQQEQQKAQQQKTQGVMNDLQLKNAKTKSDIELKQEKAKAQLEQSAAKHQLQLAAGVQKIHLADATTAAEIHRNRLKSFADSTEGN